MAAVISLYGQQNDGTLVPYNIPSVVSSGVGFYGSAFGTSVQTGQYQDTTFVTDGTGASQGPRLNNVKYTGVSTSGILWNGTATDVLQHIPNASGNINIRFTFDSAVKTQNALLYVFDRVSKNNNPSGVTCRVAELIHPWVDGFEGAGVNTGLGSGDVTWIQAQGSGQTVGLVAGPGVSGLNPDTNQTSTQHDWYVVMSASPSSIGSKTQFGCYIELEYL